MEVVNTEIDEFIKMQYKTFESLERMLKENNDHKSKSLINLELRQINRIIKLAVIIQKQLTLI